MHFYSISIVAATTQITH